MGPALCPPPMSLPPLPRPRTPAGLGCSGPASGTRTRNGSTSNRTGSLFLSRAQNVHVSFHLAPVSVSDASHMSTAVHRWDTSRCPPRWAATSSADKCTSCRDSSLTVGRGRRSSVLSTGAVILSILTLGARAHVRARGLPQDKV